MGAIVDHPWLGNLYAVLDPPWAGVVSVLCAALCGLLIGMEREHRQKAAGLRTLSLICIGATVFTIASVLNEGGSNAPGRISAQVVTGVGFLGAGAILRGKGGIIGLTTAATIWASAGVGVLIGYGYAAAGLVTTLLVLAILEGLQGIETLMNGPCRTTVWKVHVDPDTAGIRIRIRALLDDYHLPETALAEGDEGTVTIRGCGIHPAHRAFLREVCDLRGVLGVEAT